MTRNIWTVAALGILFGLGLIAPEIRHAAGDTADGSSSAPAAKVLTSEMAATAPLSDEEYSAAINDVMDLVRVNAPGATGPRRARAQALLNAIQQNKPANVYDAGLSSDDGVWIRLVDGTPVPIMLGIKRAKAQNNGALPDRGTRHADGLNAQARLLWKHGQALLRRAASVAISTVATVVSPARADTSGHVNFHLPESNKALVLEVDDTAPASAPLITDMLHSANYQVNAVSNPSLKFLREQVKDTAVLYISTHGVYFPDKSGAQRYGLVAGGSPDLTCKLAVEECKAISTDRRDGRVFTALAWIEDPNRNASDLYASFAITADFVWIYWRFTAHSLAFLDACNSADVGAAATSDAAPPDADTPDANATDAGTGAAGAAEAGNAYARENFLLAIKAGTVLGWTNEVTVGFAQSAAQWFFDRVLGANQFSPISPKQRPFSPWEVYAVMAEQDMITERRLPFATLVYTNDKQLILRPSLRNLAVREESDRLDLYGELGGESGTVEISGDIRPVVGDWSSGKVSVELPASGAGSKGLVVAKVRGFESNPVPLTDWTGYYRGKHYLIMLFGEPGPYWQTECTRVHLRGDIHKFRLKPEEPAVARFVTDTYELAVVPFGNLARDSVCINSAGGSGTKVDAAGTAIKMTFRPTTEAPVWADNQRTPGSNWFFGMGFLSPQLSTVSLNFNSAGQGLVTGTEEVVAPPPRKIRFTGPVAPFSTSMVGYEMYRRSYLWDGAYNISRMNDTYPMSLAPGDVGEVELELMTDPDSIPTVDTPG